MGKEKKWQVIGNTDPRKAGFVFHGTFGGIKQSLRGGAVFYATDEEVESQRQKVFEVDEVTPPAAPRDQATAQIANQAEAQRARNRTVKQDRMIKVAPNSVVV